MNSLGSCGLDIQFVSARDVLQRVGQHSDGHSMKNSQQSVCLCDASPTRTPLIPFVLLNSECSSPLMARWLKNLSLQEMFKDIVKLLRSKRNRKKREKTKIRKTHEKPNKQIRRKMDSLGPKAVFAKRGWAKSGRCRLWLLNKICGRSERKSIKKRSVFVSYRTKSVRTE